MTDDLDALLDRADNFGGHDNRECGEHRTVGPHRAWCFDCSEWCSPEVPCVRCEIPKLRADYNTALDVIGRLRHGWVAIYGEAWLSKWDGGGPQPLTDAERGVLAAAETRHKDQT